MSTEKELEGSAHGHDTQIVHLTQEGAKHDAAHLEFTAESVDIPDYNEKEAKKILHKIDFRLLPMLAFFYLLAYLDRGNGMASASRCGKNFPLHFANDS